MSEKIEIKELVFLTPAKLKIVVDGQEKTMMVNVDLVNKKVYSQAGDSFYSDHIFSYLDSMYILPEDFFSSSEEVNEEVAEAEKTVEEIMNQDIGEII